ncbi:hypothetical protein EVAR_56968_1 [Eumeta japonica]|uniref:Uncharacterized protein n=1 Tax=Eumeta variegata TaxID=151549 RepID=A0A4C1ZAX2_EUMVA|nr:hypothetical protein EVAR_56968_1 [Eumeta japonica]
MSAGPTGLLNSAILRFICIIEKERRWGRPKVKIQSSAGRAAGEGRRARKAPTVLELNGRLSCGAPARPPRPAPPPPDPEESRSALRIVSISSVWSVAP